MFPTAAIEDNSGAPRLGNHTSGAFLAQLRQAIPPPSPQLGAGPRNWLSVLNYACDSAAGIDSFSLSFTRR
jgi:hypothetical protein